MVSAAILFLTLASCGLEESPENEALLRLEGSIVNLDEGSWEHSTYLGIVWVNWAKSGDTVRYETLAEVSVEDLPSGFELSSLPEPREEDLNRFGTMGFLGTGFLFAFEDADEDGVFFEESDEAIGISGGHMLVYAKGMTQPLRNWLEENGIVLNPDELMLGYYLARGVCASPGETFDHLRVVGPEPVEIRSHAEVRDDDEACLNIF
jgi:hypothetical protein